MEQDDVNERVAAILDGVQDSAATHARYLKEFTKLCEVAGPDKVLRKCLMPALQHILVVLKREPTVERLVSFLIQFASQSQFDIQGRPFPVHFMCELLPFTNAAKGNRDTEVTKAVRFRSTQLVAGVLNALSEETELKNDVWNSLETHLVQRASDKVPLIRIQAALGLSRLQDVEESANAASQAYLRLLSSDPNKEVRRTALKNLVTSRHTLQAIVDRVRDVSHEVRAETFRVLTAQVRMKMLTISQRVFLVQSGLRDRDASVRKESVVMCLEWLKAAGGSIPALLKAFDVENTEESIVETLIEALLEHSDLTHIDWRKSESMTSELAVLWRVFIEWHMKKAAPTSASSSGSTPASIALALQNRKPEIVEANLPETLIEYCELVTNIATEMENSSSYVLRQILKLAPSLDKSDEGGRRAILGLLTEISSESMVEEEDIAPLASAIASFSFGIQDFVNRLYEALLKSRAHLDLFQRPENAKIIQQHEMRITELKHTIGPVHFHKVIKKLRRLESNEDDAANSEGSDDESTEIAARKDSKLQAPQRNGESIEEATEELKELLTLKSNRRRVTEWSWIRTLTLAQNIFAHLSNKDLDATIPGSLHYHYPAQTATASDEEEVEEPRKNLAQTLLELVPRYLGVGMSHSSENVRLAAIKAIGVLATADFKRNAVQNVELLYHALSNDELRIRNEALKVLFDLVMVAGFEAFSDDPSTPFEPRKETDFEELSTPFDYPEHSVFAVLYHHLHENSAEEDDRLQTTAVEGFTKLFAAKRLNDAHTIGKLLELLFDPNTNENATLQQSLSLFMPMFAFASYQNQQIFANSFKSTLRNFLHASSDSSLAEAHLPTYLRFILHLTDPIKLNDMHGKEMRPENAASLQNTLATEVCYEMLTAPGSKHVKNLVKFFSFFEIDCKDASTIRKLEMLLRRVQVAIKADKIAEKAIAATISALKISEDIAGLEEDDHEAALEEMAESTANALSTLSVAKSAPTQKKAPPKSTKKLVSSKRRLKLADSDSDASDSDLDLASDLSTASSSDDDTPTTTQSSNEERPAKKTAIGKRSAAAKKSATSRVAKSTTQETVAAKKSVSRKLVLEEDESDTEEEEEEEEEKKVVSKKVVASRPKAVIEESSDDDLMLDSDLEVTIEEEDVSVAEEQEEEVKEVVAEIVPVKAPKRTARASSVSKATSATASTTTTKASAAAPAKKAAVPKKTSKAPAVSGASTITAAPKAPSTNAKENEKNPSRSSSASASMAAQKPAVTSKVSNTKTSTTAKATTAAAAKTSNTKASAKLAEQSRLMKEMEAMLD